MANSWTASSASASADAGLAARSALPFFPLDATAAELLAHRLDGKRAARISVAAGAANATRGGSGGVVAPVVSGLAQGSGEYFTKIGVGTPATPALMVLDTGSDVVWLHCYEQSGQVFDPRRSGSYGAVDNEGLFVAAGPLEQGKSRSRARGWSTARIRRSARLAASAACMLPAIPRNRWL